VQRVPQRPEPSRAQGLSDTGLGRIATVEMVAVMVVISQGSFSSLSTFATPPTGLITHRDHAEAQQPHHLPVQHTLLTLRACTLQYARAS